MQQFKRYIGIDYSGAETADSNLLSAEQKVSGIKRHITVGMLGLFNAITVTTADVTGRAGALRAITRCASNLQ